MSSMKENDSSDDYLKFFIESVKDFELCLKPLYTSISDKNGQKSDKFYVRSGNSSPELPITEVTSYINARFA